MNCLIREMNMEDYPEVRALWERTEGLKLDESDEYTNLERYILRNPKLNYVAEVHNQIIGTIKCGQDGRRGYLYHLAVDTSYRKQGVSKLLFSKCLNELKKQNIFKCTVYVLEDNDIGLNYWQHHGWEKLDSNFHMLQKKIDIIK